jgi:hypothetical protein
LVEIGQQMKGTYVEAEVVFHLYLAFHFSDVNETSHPILSNHALQTACVWLKSFKNEGHFTWKSKKNWSVSGLPLQ